MGDCDRDWGDASKNGDSLFDIYFAKPCGLKTWKLLFFNMCTCWMKTVYAQFLGSNCMEIEFVKEEWNDLNEDNKSLNY